MTKLADLLNQSDFVFYFLVVDNFLDIHLYPELKNFHIIYAYKHPPTPSPCFCLEDHHIKLTEKNSGRLLSHPKVIDYIKNTSKNRPVVIVPFKPSAKIDLICQRQHWLVASNPPKLNRLLEDKVKFLQICQQNQIPTLPAVIDYFNRSNFQKYQALYGPNLVIQTHFGWAGKSTYNFTSWNQALTKIPADTLVKFGPFLQGYTLLNNCCLTHLGLLQSPPALQYTGLKPFTNNPFATVGRQWPSFAPKKIISEIQALTQKFSTVLSALNYKGFFGLDFFIYQNQVYLLECNPRLTASFAFYTGLENSTGWTPLFLFHLAEFINITYNFNIDQESKRFFDPNIVGSEITFKNNQGTTIKKFHFTTPLSPQAKPIKLNPTLISHLVT